MTDAIIPVELGRKALALVERTHQTVNPRVLPGKIATRRNAVAMAMLPEGTTILRAATSTFKIRVFLWIMIPVVLAISWMLTWWLAILGALILIGERILATKERRFWILLAAMLLSAEIVATNFAGWGAAYPSARQAAIEAFGFDAGTPTEWLDYYLPHRSDLGPDLVKAFRPLNSREG